MIVAPLGVSNPGEQMYHFTSGRLDTESPRRCDATCSYPQLVAHGDRTGMVVTGVHQRAHQARDQRRRPRREHRGLKAFVRSVRRRLFHGR
jgi:hypothetical protein